MPSLMAYLDWGGDTKELLPLTDSRIEELGLSKVWGCLKTAGWRVIWL